MESSVPILAEPPFLIKPEPPQPALTLFGVPIYCNPNLPITVRAEDGAEYELVSIMRGPHGKLVLLTGKRISKDGTDAQPRPVA